MKEATGELNMTVITVVAIAAVAAFFYALIWPSIKASVLNNQCEAECGENNFDEATASDMRSGKEDWDCTCNTNNRYSGRK